jgi:SAM-dependent methyltransferase
VARVAPPEERLRREIEHHRELAGRHTEEIWGWDTPAGRVRADRRARLFIELGGITRGARVLELGCGTGEFTRRVAPEGARLVALDLSADLLAKARARVLSGARFLRGDAQRLPFRAGAFDVVYGCSILHHLDVETALGEARRVLRPGGQLVVSEPNLLNPQVALMFKVRALRPRFGVSEDETAFTRRHVSNLLRRAGFASSRVRYFDFLHPATPAALVPRLASLGERLEAVPGLRVLAGSMLIHAEG